MSAFRLVASVFLAFILSAAPAQALLRIDITKGNVEPLPIALPELAGGQVGRDIMEVVAADLERSGLFKVIPQAAYIEQVTAATTVPRYADWRQIEAAGLVTGSVVDTGGGRLKVAFRLFDVFAEEQIAGKEYNTFTTNWRRIAHIMADEIYKRITGESGYFDSRVVYVAESGSALKRVKRLAIMDQDGANHKFLTDGRYLVLTPRFSPNSQEILYMSYAGKQPRVFLRDLQTGREESLGAFEGMSFAPRFSNDGRSIVMSIAQGGSTNIYRMDLSTRRMSKLTSGNVIDTSPSFAPDGTQIVFNSDRGGSQQLYTMSASGGDIKRISFGDGRYGTPVWSPRGDLIAFTKMSGGRFFIGVMRPDGSGERVLTESYLDEGPSWSPNGRVIIFNRQWPSSGGAAGRSRLYSVDLTGYNLREVTTPIDSSDPAWSPLLPL
ncbi:MAG: Tol-Pal system beta propeller repeat protein TolB [Alphaproteobacteria bacterium]|nr:Tol-Pal system beta propeller repeat protein TolB [Alphaproteobacteria bacterium]